MRGKRPSAKTNETHRVCIHAMGYAVRCSSVAFNVIRLVFCERASHSLCSFLFVCNDYITRNNINTGLC